MRVHSYRSLVLVVTWTLLKWMVLLIPFGILAWVSLFAALVNDMRGCPRPVDDIPIVRLTDKVMVLLFGPDREC